MIVREGDRFYVKGAVTIDNVRLVLEAGSQLFDEAEPLVDLSQVAEVDSSAVSMMMEWMRQAQQKKRRIRFANLPPNLKSLAALYGVAELIPTA